MSIKTIIAVVFFVIFAIITFYGMWNERDLDTKQRLGYTATGCIALYIFKYMLT